MKIKVPLGTFKIKYALGEVWYGRQYLFGPSTRAAILDEDFEFKNEGGKISGYTITLIKQKGGNLHIQEISIDEF